jgi:hypothetical protein
VSSLRQWGLDDKGAQVFVLCVVSVVTGLLGAWFLVTGTVQLVDTARILTGGERATATVVAIEETVRDPTSAVPETITSTIVGFTTDAGTEVEAVLPATGAQPDYAVGEKVAVIVDDESPRDVLIDDGGILASQWLAIVAAVVLLAITVTTGIRAMRIFRSSRDGSVAAR